MVATLDQFREYVGVNANGQRQRSTPTEDRRCRWQVRVWLDIAKDAEYAMAEQLAKLKEARQMTSTIRDALTLLFSLQRHDISILERLFPFVADHYRAKYTAAGQGGIQQQLDALKAEIAALKSAPVQPTGPRPLSVPTIPAPVDDDDADALEIRKAKSDGVSAQNFLASAFALIQ